MSKIKMSKFQTIICNAGKTKVAAACGVSNGNVTRWFKNGCLPASDYLTADHKDRTNYAAAIARLAKCRPADLL